jgi:hypothetical protein
MRQNLSSQIADALRELQELASEQVKEGDRAKLNRQIVLCRQILIELSQAAIVILPTMLSACVKPLRRSREVDRALKTRQWCRASRRTPDSMDPELPDRMPVVPLAPPIFAPKIKFAMDSSLEGNGFEPSVPER